MEKAGNSYSSCSNRCLECCNCSTLTFADTDAKTIIAAFWCWKGRFRLEFETEMKSRTKEGRVYLSFVEAKQRFEPSIEKRIYFRSEQDTYNKSLSFLRRNSPLQTLKQENFLQQYVADRWLPKTTIMHAASSFLSKCLCWFRAVCLHMDRKNFCWAPSWLQLCAALLHSCFLVSSILIKSCGRWIWVKQARSDDTG